MPGSLSRVDKPSVPHSSVVQLLSPDDSLHSFVTSQCAISRKGPAQLPGSGSIPTAAPDSAWGYLTMRMCPGKEEPGTLQIHLNLEGEPGVATPGALSSSRGNSGKFQRGSWIHNSLPGVSSTGDTKRSTESIPQGMG
ncbi:hypothetical protein DV515_00009373 [Chloebia gouldiae]|uniref:Uncharacterized protein n=1 Tax=Chloebia gouldiae TaxID=44316 RepID=A0A3L8SCN0_CHLGU|nr:hypothetical protein DV515_00009373 [Chloebia gouldiae]